MRYESWSARAILEEMGARIRLERLNRDLSQKDLATATGMSISTIRNIESGDGNPTMRVIIEVLRALGLLDRIDALLPEPAPSPIQAAKLRRRQRQRASGTQPRDPDDPGADGSW